jgi:hypothetical protein
MFMKKIYVSHTTSFDFKEKLYKPLKKLKEFELILPHEKSETPEHSKDIIKTCSAIVAEISIPSHGVGIEIGWADSFGIPIIFIFKKNSKISTSLKLLSNNFIGYDRVENILPKLAETLYHTTR